MTEKAIMIRLTEKEADAVAEALFDYAEGIKLMYQEYLKADFMKGDKEAVQIAERVRDRILKAREGDTNAP